MRLDRLIGIDGLVAEGDVDVLVAGDDLGDVWRQAAHDGVGDEDAACAGSRCVRSGWCGDCPGLSASTTSATEVVGGVAFPGLMRDGRHCLSWVVWAWDLIIGQQAVRSRWSAGVRRSR